MKKSDLKNYIKENIIETLTESPSSEEIRMARQALVRFMKYRNVEQDEAIRDLMNALEYLKTTEVTGLKEASSEEVKNQKDLNKELEKTAKLKQQVGMEENTDVDDKDAIAQAKAARGKHKKLDIAVKALNSLSTEMKSLARDYSKAEGEEKEKIKNELKTKTPKKKELEALVAKLEKDVI
jgi:hypothetical protein